jgi:hypothetical protein
VKEVMSRSEEFVVDGFLTFVHVNSQGRAIPHDIIIEAVTAIYDISQPVN